MWGANTLATSENLCDMLEARQSHIQPGAEILLAAPPRQDNGVLEVAIDSSHHHIDQYSAKSQTVRMRVLQILR